MSLCATSGIYLGKAYHFGLVRPGIGLYGGQATHTPEKEVTDAEVVEEKTEKPEPDQDKDAAPKEAERAPETSVETVDEATGEVTQQREVDLGQLKNLLDMILRDLADGAPIEALEDMYAEQIALMKTSAPDLHKELTDEFKAYREAPTQTE